MTNGRIVLLGATGYTGGLVLKHFGVAASDQHWLGEISPRYSRSPNVSAG
jgi:short subunit dehydrogenase-like uncharacterized protein